MSCGGRPDHRSPPTAPSQQEARPHPPQVDGNGRSETLENQGIRQQVAPQRRAFRRQSRYIPQRDGYDGCGEARPFFVFPERVANTVCNGVDVTRIGVDDDRDVEVAVDRVLTPGNASKQLRRHDARVGRGGLYRVDDLVEPGAFRGEQNVESSDERMAGDRLEQPGTTRTQALHDACPLEVGQLSLPETTSHSIGGAGHRGWAPE
jgi:hypothetical protein